jgi:hypothetical protein
MGLLTLSGNHIQNPFEGQCVLWRFSNTYG